jgi:carbamoyl-phosphate synthase large subunit
MVSLGIEFSCTHGTAAFLRENGIACEELYWPSESNHPNTVDIIRDRKVDLVINIPKNFQEEELTNDYTIRRMAVDYNVPLVTNTQIAMRLAEALSHRGLDDLEIKSWREYSQPKSGAVLT